MVTYSTLDIRNMKKISYTLMLPSTYYEEHRCPLDCSVMAISMDDISSQEGRSVLDTMVRNIYTDPGIVEKWRIPVVDVIGCYADELYKHDFVVLNGMSQEENAECLRHIITTTHELTKKIKRKNKWWHKIF